MDKHQRKHHSKSGPTSTPQLRDSQAISTPSSEEGGKREEAAGTPPCLESHQNPQLQAITSPSIIPASKNWAKSSSWTR